MRRLASQPIRWWRPRQRAIKPIVLGSTKDSTKRKNSDALALYDRILAIQNAADLEWPETKLENAGGRDEFRLNTFPLPHRADADPPPRPLRRRRNPDLARTVRSER